MVYKGIFRKGLYDGAGTEFYPDTGYIRYEGEFLDDRYQGEGKLYDAGGVMIYEGSFQCGQFEGRGILYDAESGRILCRGTFHLGGLLISEEDLDMPGQPEEQQEE